MFLQLCLSLLLLELVRLGILTLQLLGLVLDLLLQYRDVFLQRLLRRVRSPRLPFKRRYPRLHLLLLDFPGVTVPLVTMPFRLEKAHDTCRRNARISMLS